MHAEALKAKRSSSSRRKKRRQAGGVCRGPKLKHRLRVQPSCHRRLARPCFSKRTRAGKPPVARRPAARSLHDRPSAARQADAPRVPGAATHRRPGDHAAARAGLEDAAEMGRRPDRPPTSSPPSSSPTTASPVSSGWKSTTSQYWFRLLDCIAEDFPGLEAVLGIARCNRLYRAYLAKYPSRSFTLRNLGDRLPQFLADEPQWAGDRHAISPSRWPGSSGPRWSPSTAKPNPR